MTRNTLQCQMRDDCHEPVSHIEDRGFIYCQEHAVSRRQSGWGHTRKLRPWEIRLLLAGEPVPTYEPLSKPEVRIHFKCRDIGYGIEEGERYGRWTGERDIRGKRTFQPMQGKTLYLFDDEIVGEKRIA